jgi:hypothetical protein
MNTIKELEDKIFFAKEELKKMKNAYLHQNTVVDKLERKLVELKRNLDLNSFKNKYFLIRKEDCYFYIYIKDIKFLISYNVVCDRILYNKYITGISYNYDYDITVPIGDIQETDMIRGNYINSTELISISKGEFETHIIKFE